MTPASSEHAGEKFNPSTIRPFSPEELRTERMEVRADGTGDTVPRVGAGGSIGSSLHQPEHALRTDPRLRQKYGGGGSRGSVRGGGRGSPQATAPADDHISPERFWARDLGAGNDQ
eukprot:2368355-Pleurochrysis_carterae.AAC.2